jgi:uncharacterized repeat protein (TIGR03806 family)
MKYYHYWMLTLGALLLFVSCKNDDDVYVILPIETTADVAQVIQGEMVALLVLVNDINIEEEALLSFSTPSTGTASIDTFNTMSVLDDAILYSAPEDFIGDVSFTYTICNTAQSCKKELITITVVPSSQVNFDPSIEPFLILSSYNFFAGDIKSLTPNPRVLPYKPISSLFSDYALKKRFLWMPDGVKASYNGDGEPLDFPVGTVLIKNFYYENVLPSNDTRIIETRLLYKTDTGYKFAEYIWNEEQTEAFLDVEGDGGFTDVTWLQDGEKRTVTYRTPAGSECFTCHKSNAENAPIGLKPQSLNSEYPYPEATQNQLSKFIDIGYLEDNLPPNITTVIDYTDETQTLDLRVRSYLDINCASCHQDEGHCNYRSMRFAFDENETLENRGVCVDPDDFFPELEAQKIVKPGDPENSVLFVRLSTNEQNRRMPLLGRNSLHIEGIELLEQWIIALAETCD